MPRHVERTSVRFPTARLCMDEVTESDFPYAIVWRGTVSSPDGFIPRPAYFDPASLGQLIRRTIENVWPQDEAVSFWRSLLGFVDTNQPH
jgi:hypothetical protein